MSIVMDAGSEWVKWMTMGSLELMCSIGHCTADSNYLHVTVITRGKNYINTVRFLTKTARFVSRH